MMRNDFRCLCACVMFSRELTLFWSKLLMRLESSADAFLGQSKEMALLCRSVCHILFLIKVIQNEVRKTVDTLIVSTHTNINNSQCAASDLKIKSVALMLYFFFISAGWRGGASSVCGNVHSSSENDLQ